MASYLVIRTSDPDDIRQCDTLDDDLVDEAADEDVVIVDAINRTYLDPTTGKWCPVEDRE